MTYHLQIQATTLIASTNTFLTHDSK